MKFSSSLFVIFFLNLFLFETNAWAKNGWPTCPEKGRYVDVYVESSIGNLRYRNGFNSAQLSRMRGTVGRRLGPNWSPTGLTLAENRYELKTATKIYDLGRGRFCAVLSKANLFLGFKDIDVFVSNKYRQGSCEYDSILNHENTHVSIFRDTLYKHSSGIERAIRQKAPKIGPIYLRSANSAANQVQKLLDAKIRPLFLRMERELDRRNAKIDKKSNYRHEQSLCANW